MYAKMLKDELHGFGVRLMVLNVVGADNHTYIILQLEGAHEAIERGSPATAADGQLQATSVEPFDGIKNMRKEFDDTWMVIFIEDAAVDLGTPLGSGVVDRRQADKAFLQRQSYNRAAFGISARRQAQFCEGAVQGADDKRLSVGQRTVEVQNYKSCHFCAARYCSSRRWTYLPKTSNSMFTTVPGLKLWKLVTL